MQSCVGILKRSVSPGHGKCLANPRASKLWYVCLRRRTPQSSLVSVAKAGEKVNSKAPQEAPQIEKIVGHSLPSPENSLQGTVGFPTVTVRHSPSTAPGFLGAFAGSSNDGGSMFSAARNTNTTLHCNPRTSLAGWAGCRRQGIRGTDSKLNTLQVQVEGYHGSRRSRLP